MLEHKSHDVSKMLADDADGSRVINMASLIEDTKQVQEADNYASS